MMKIISMFFILYNINVDSSTGKGKMKTPEKHKASVADTITPESRKGSSADEYREIPNLEIRRAMFNSGIKQFQLAKLLGISEAGVYRLLREELPAEKKEMILRAIKDDAKSRLRSIAGKKGNQK